MKYLPTESRRTRFGQQRDPQSASLHQACMVRILTPISLAARDAGISPGFLPRSLNSLHLPRIFADLLAPHDKSFFFATEQRFAQSRCPIFIFPAREP